MKKTMFLIVLLSTILVTQQAHSQASISVNIGVQPVWGPVGYDYVNYYYIPDIDAYYDVPNRVYIYQDGGVWVRRPSLPPAFVGYDLYHGYKVVINDRDPWLRHDVYRNKYVVYKGHHDQAFIRDSREQRYYQIKEHPMHGQYHPDNHPVQHQAAPQNNRVVEHGNGHGNGGGNGHGGDKGHGGH
ncbi:MAG: hypothetical protein JWO03_4011 [Bacteroidetes bacterium]|nr:hypothetical protein [Bacteroidota bacterium]